MLKYLSFTYILVLLFLGYVVNTIWSLSEIFIPPECNRGERCFASYLKTKPPQNLVLYTSIHEHAYIEGDSSDSVTKIYTALNYNYLEPATFQVIKPRNITMSMKRLKNVGEARMDVRIVAIGNLKYHNHMHIANDPTGDIKLQVPYKSRRNGTLFMHVMLLDDRLLYRDYDQLRKTESVLTLPLITHIEPQAATFNLLHQKGGEEKSRKKLRPYAHISKFVPISILTDDLNFPYNKIPGELYSFIRIRDNKFLPIIQHNVLKSRISQLQLLNSSMNEWNMTISVSPASYGLTRLALHVHLALDHLRSLGFSQKDVDDVKGIFADTNLYLLSATVLIASFHLLFDFLAFKNDVSFWRQRRSLAGLSARTIFWRAFSQLIIFFYLLDEQTSMLLLVPAGISAVIELWKVNKVLHIRVSFTGGRLRVWRDTSADAGEQSTAQADAEAMRYLSMLLYPLCIAGAIYSLVYEPHKSWYSWALHSTVNGVYAFGFLFMLPQLFVNYRLRSVAALPWRAFMYKAFNTFIDDIFAFIITMPTAHRVACFRDDLVFLVYLYQRWLYPIDKNRIDMAVSMDEASEEKGPLKTIEESPLKTIEESPLKTKEEAPLKAKEE